MLIAIISDSHAGARLNLEVFQSYFSRFYNEIFFPYLKEHDIKTIIHAGDIMESRKYTNHSILNGLKKTFLNPIMDNDIKMHLIEGNHDQYFNNTNKLDAPTELFGHIKNIDIYKHPGEVEIGGLKFLFIPWIIEETKEQTFQLIQNSDASVVIGHLELNGFEVIRGQVMNDGMDPNILKKFDMVLSGHFHYRSSRNNIQYLGTPYEMTFSDCDDIKGFHILDTETLELTFIENPLKMFYKIQYDDTDKTFDTIRKEYPLDLYTDKYIKVIVKARTNPYYFDRFLDALYKKNPADITILEDFVYESGEDEKIVADSGEDTLTVLLRFADELQTSIDKNKIKDELKILYSEAGQL